MSSLKNGSWIIELGQNCIESIDKDDKHFCQQLFCYQYITSGHGFQPVDEKTCILNSIVVNLWGFYQLKYCQRLSNRFTLVECKPMNYVLSNNPFHSSPICLYFPSLFAVQWLFNDFLHVRTIWKKLTQWNINLMLFNENVSRIVCFCISLAATECTCNGSRSSYLSYLSILVLITFKSSSEFVNLIKLFQDIGYGWIAMLSLAQQFFLPNIFFCLQYINCVHTGEREVMEQKCISTSTL